MQTLAIILGALGSILGGTSILLHLIAPRTKTLLDDHAAAAVDALVAKLKAITPGLGLLFVIALGVGSIALAPACTHNTRNQTIAVALTTLNGTRDTFEAYDEAHQVQLVDAAPDKAAADAQLAAYRAKRATFVKALAIAYVGIETAIRVDDDASVHSMLAAVEGAAAELVTLGAAPVTLPGAK